MATRSPTVLRRERERELVLATRALFDERGMLDAPIEEIARSVGIARGLVYRQFSSKEELFVLTVTDYLDELAAELAAAIGEDGEPVTQLERAITAYANFCHRYPAFIDSSLSLMQRPARELHEVVSDSVWLRLGQGMAECVDQLIDVLAAGVDAGTLDVQDSDYMANVLWTQVLGAMHLARIRVGVRSAAPGIPELFSVEPERVVETCVASALATVGNPGARGMRASPINVGSPMTSEHLDVLIVGAGLSGIGAGSQLEMKCPGKSYAVLEARDDIGGTWDKFRYPGIRSDSDMFTLGYAFRPWTQPKTIADGPSILQYVRDTAREYRVDEKIRFRHRVVRAEWSTAEARWTVEVERGEERETILLTCGFLFMCSGYYRYDEPYTPQFAGTERFRGRIVHPQHWTDDVDYAGKRVVVIGSGATAVTLVPAMAESAEHVTMLQRSPSYVAALPSEDPLANFIRRVLPTKLAYSVVRWKNVFVTMGFFNLSRRRPNLIRGMLRRAAVRQLPAGYDVDTHFNPTYNPWDQRMCLIPDGDLFKALSSGRASVVTDHIETFTETGIRLSSGVELEADLVVTATGLNMLALGGLQIAVDGRELRLPETLTYKGLMLAGVPNLAFSIGYTNASWTLKCDLTCDWVCRVLNHMDEHGYAQCMPPRDPGVVPEPMIDFSSGYVQRSIHLFPKQSAKVPWRLHQNYPRDVRMLRHGAIDDGTLQFTRGRRAAEAPDPVAA